jgi:excisionase family DNA binding protein
VIKNNHRHNANIERSLTAAEACDVLGISRRTLTDLTKPGGIPCFRIGGALRVWYMDLHAWMDSQKQAEAHRLAEEEAIFAPIAEFQNRTAKKKNPTGRKGLVEMERFCQKVDPANDSKSPYDRLAALQQSPDLAEAFLKKAKLGTATDAWREALRADSQLSKQIAANVAQLRGSQ